MSKSPFAEKLQRLMDEKGMSQSDVARAVWGSVTDERGYEVAKNRQVLSKYLRGVLSPRVTTVRQIADSLHVPVSSLIQTDPLSQPGSGILVVPVDNKTSRLDIEVVVPREVARQVVEILLEYGK